MTQLQLVQDTNAILEQWRSHYEREIVHLQLAKVDAENLHKDKMIEFENTTTIVRSSSLMSL